jgi:hypothetical protein
MISLTISVAILDKLTRRTCLETSAPLFAAVGTTDDVDLVHHGEEDEKLEDEA